METLIQAKNTELQKAMNCLSESHLLIDGNFYDAAANRAYYALFHTMRYGLYVVNKSDEANAKTHNGLIRLFSQYLIKENFLAPSIGSDISELLSLRQIADYSGEFLEEKDAQFSILTATHILHELQKLDHHLTSNK